MTSSSLAGSPFAALPFPPLPLAMLANSEALAHAIIGGAFLTIAGTMLYLVSNRRRSGLLYPAVFAVFALFLGLSAIAHFREAFAPAAAPGVMLVVLAFIAALAVAAAGALIRVAPQLLGLPSRDELRRLNAKLEERVALRTADLTGANTRLRQEIEQREIAEAEIRRLSAEMETRIAELQSLFNVLPVGVAISADASCRHLRTNQAFAELFGTTAPRDGALTLSPFDGPEALRIVHDGRELPPHDLPMQRAIAANSAVRDFDATIGRRDAPAIDVIVNVVPIRDADGRPGGCVATFQDISAHKLAERRRLDFERKLLQSQKLEGIGVLAGGIAHDFNNLLTGVLGHANFARSELARGVTEVDHLLAQVELSAQRAADLCRQLLAYAGKGRFVVRLIDLNVAVEQAVPLLKLSMSKKVTLDLQLGAGLPPFRGDASQLNQVLMNLVANSSEAIGNALGTVTIRTDRVSLSPMDLLTMTMETGMEPGAFVALEVRDTGCGIPAEALAHIFEPFFTTKFVGRGLGLSAVLGIVQGHRGGLRVTSQVGAGTTFELFFPVAAAPVRDSTPPVALPPPATPPARGTVLVADDEPSVLNFAATALRAAGFSVVTAVDGEDALAQLRADPLRFDLALLDLAMPRLDGEDALMALRMVAPSLPIVLTSGHDEQRVAKRFVGRGVADFIAKPFVSERLVSAVDAAIARSKATVG